MPWNESAPMDERVKFVAVRLAGEEPFSATCARFGVSRKTGYKWMERYEAGGVAELADRSRAPLTHPHAVSDEVSAELIGARKEYPRWGPRKLLVIVRRRRPDLELPATSTVGELLKREGLVRKKRKRIRSAPYAEPLGGYVAPNSVWCADFKGHFPVAGRRCHPLTISDGYSRFLLCCKALPRPLFGPTRKAFERTFRQYGLPEAIRTDNGSPFSTLAPGGLSRLAVWWIRLGIRPERIEPGRPDQNGRHERMHGTLKAEVCRSPRHSFTSQQSAFDAFCDEYNNVRPHEALDLETPASKYHPSPRSFPNRLPEIEYPSHFELVRAYPNGVITLRGSQWYVSNAVKQEVLGLQAVDDGRWRVYFGPVPLGILDVRRAKERGRRAFGALIRADEKVDHRPRRKLYRR